MTMTGQQLYPIGDLMFEDLVDVYKEQAEVVADAGADLLSLIHIYTLSFQEKTILRNGRSGRSDVYIKF